MRNPSRTAQHHGASSGRSPAASAAAKSATRPDPNAATARNVTKPVSMPETAQAAIGEVAAKQSRSATPYGAEVRCRSRRPNPKTATETSRAPNHLAAPNAANGPEPESGASR